MRIVKIVFIVGLWFSLALGLVIAWYAAELPHIVQATNFTRKTSITIKAADGSIIGRYGDLKGEAVDARDVPDLVHAIIATEDRRFYRHHGIDTLGVIRAMGVNVLHGHLVQGGSTVTQQLAKNLFLTQDRTFKRKIQEALLALWLEHQLTKDEIMTAYLNRVYMGSGAFGAEAASEVYFDHPAKALTIDESAMLAGLLKAPTRYSPQTNLKGSEDRAKIVLAAMLEEKYISPKKYKLALRFGHVATPADKPGPGDTQRYYTDYIINTLTDLIGTPDRDLIVQTTLWPRSERAAEATVNSVLVKQGEKKNAHQGAVVMMDTDGAIRVMVGGRDYGKSQFNRATQSLRQPGSTFKPFVYLTALENGWHPDDMIDDAPVTIGKYHPGNFKNEYYGEVPLHFALSHSLNSAAIQLARNVGIGKVIATAHNLGVKTKLQNNLSLALGSNGVPLIEMVAAYDTMNNDGIGIDPYAIENVKATDGTILYQHEAKVTPLQVAPEYAVRELAGMMEETIDEGTGVRARLPYLAAGKTGTSQDYRDAWFMGFSGPFTAGVWVGNDDNSSMKAVTGGSLPADIWKQVMLTAYAEAKDRSLSLDSPNLSRAPTPPAVEPDQAPLPVPAAAATADGGFVPTDPNVPSAAEVPAADTEQPDDADQQFIGGGPSSAAGKDSGDLPSSGEAKDFNAVLKGLQ